jgi:4-hydroxy-3-methylbut-2-en-1-yl diphosphate reductase
VDVIIAKTAGFCWGVERTVDKVFEIADEASGPVVTLGPVIHNPQAVAKIAERGVGTASQVSEVSDGTTVIVRTHGATKEELALAKERGLQVVDGTCPYVKYPQAMAARLSRDGYHVIVVGDAKHAEIKGVVSYAEGPCTVVAPGQPVPELKAKKVAVIAQTTIQGEELQKVAAALVLRHKEVRVVNTICYDTDERQNDARDLASQVDAVIVVGGRNSANTRHLAEICHEIQPRTWHVETAAEIDPLWLAGCSRVGVSAGASTPGWVVDEVATALRRL